MGVCHFATTETKVHEVLVLDPFLDPDSHHYTLAESWVSLNEIFQSKIFEPTSLKGLSNGIQRIFDANSTKNSFRSQRIAQNDNYGSIYRKELLVTIKSQNEQKYHNKYKQIQQFSTINEPQTLQLVLTSKLTMKQNNELKKCMNRINKLLKQLNINVKRLQTERVDQSQLDSFIKITLKDNPNSISYYRGPCSITVRQPTNSAALQGKGQLYFQDGKYYNGEFEGNMFNGNGFLLHENNDYYIGQWRRNQAHGVGVYNHYEGVMYKGEWKNDEQNGRGEELWTDGAHFEGIYQKGKKKFGLLRWPNGTSFEGEFSNNKMTGKGMFRWPDNRFYYGQWYEGAMHGEGVFSWSNSQFYKGGYSQDKKHGRGMLYLPDGTIVRGQWYNGKLQGTGEVQVNGVVTITKWKNGVDVQ